MGGPGSTRWVHHRKRTVVEDCIRLPMRVLHRPLSNGTLGGRVVWKNKKRIIGDLDYLVVGDHLPRALRLLYTITRHDGSKIDCDYHVRLTITDLPWEEARFWFMCPNVECERRVSVLYQAPGEIYFACRHCLGLSYRSRQEGYKKRMLYVQMAQKCQDSLPGITWEEIRDIWG